MRRKSGMPISLFPNYQILRPRVFGPRIRGKVRSLPICLMTSATNMMVVNARTIRSGFPLDGSPASCRGGACQTTPQTQYLLMSDASLVVPCPCTPKRFLLLPSATSPLARLPFQAGVCMRLGYGYFRTCLSRTGGTGHYHLSFFSTRG